MAKTCFECGSPKRLTNHHVIPKILGGTKTLPLCSSCHGKVHDRKNISHSALTKTALARLQKQGRRVGPVPYGFDLMKDGKHLKKNGIEQKGIRKILVLRAQGWSYPGIAQELDRLNIRSKNGGRWNQATVNGLVHKHGKNLCKQPTTRREQTPKRAYSHGFNATIRESQACKIRRRVFNGEKPIDLAGEYGLTRDTIYRITQGRHWANAGLTELTKTDRAPYGFDLSVNGQSLTKNPVEQKGIRLALRLRREGHSFPSISQELNLKGFCTKKGNRWNSVTANRLVKKWGSDDLHRGIRRPSCGGISKRRRPS